MHSFIRSLAVLASLALSVPTFAAPFTGSQVTITSIVNGGPAESVVATVGAPTTFGASPEVSPPTFSWMIEGDFIDLYRNSNPNAPETLSVHFSADHFLDAGDTIEIMLELAEGFGFGPIALTEALSVRIPEAYVTGNLLYFKIDGLDQIGEGLTGLATYKFAVVPVPEPSTLALFGLALMLLCAARNRRMAASVR